MCLISGLLVCQWNGVIIGWVMAWGLLATKPFSKPILNHCQLDQEQKPTWWRHKMEPFSALQALCAGNSPVPVNSPHKGQWRGALMFSLICAWINDWVNNREAGDLRRHSGHYVVNVMQWFLFWNVVCKWRPFCCVFGVLTRRWQWQLLQYDRFHPWYTDYVHMTGTNSQCGGRTRQQTNRYNLMKYIGRNIHWKI